ncbi:hypothetical protein OG589_27525 [Sphaerisporangium sp. NBC_01403]
MGADTLADLAVRLMSTGDVAALVLVGAFVVACLVLAWQEHRRRD